MTQDEKLELDEHNRSWMFEPTELADMTQDRLTSTAKSIVNQRDDVNYSDLSAQRIHNGSNWRIIVGEIKE